MGICSPFLFTRYYPMVALFIYSASNLFIFAKRPKDFFFTFPAGRETCQHFSPQLSTSARLLADAGGFKASPRIIINQARLGRTRLSSFVRNSIFSELQRNVILSFFPLSFSLVLNSFLCKNQGKSFK